MPAEREVSVTIKASQLFASLHFTGVIRDNDEILSVVFDNSVVGKTIKGEPDVGIPIKIRFKKQEKVPT